jgi:monoamine oxidase
MVTTNDGRGFGSDYVVLAVPQPTWGRIAFTPPIPDTYLISTGPAVKYLSPLDGRFWLAAGQAPYGMSDDVGMIWEGTDNQVLVGDQGVELSLFAGGPSAEAALEAEDPPRYFGPRLDAMLPGFQQHVAGPGTFIAWPREEWTQCGYSCPAMGEVTTAGPLLARMFADRVAFAGEHTVMAMFGYMEGALESGVIAARNIVRAAGLKADEY